MRGRVYFGLIVLIVVCSAPLPASAQPPAVQPPAGQPPAGGPPPGQRGQAGPRNLQVLPKDMPQQALQQRMREFTFALGVRCDYCHKTVEGQQQPVFASDDKIEKQKAREMLKMVTTINDTLLTAVPGHTASSAKVDCVTCHRGLPIPRTLQAVLTESFDKGGVDAVVAKYRELRDKDLTSGRYDFGESTLSEMARAQGQKGNLDAAIRLAELNSEVYPKSGDLDFQLGEFYLQKGDKDKALARFKMTVEKLPNHNRAKARIAELEKK